jgi:peptide/nickel transport system permease protein
MLAGKLDEAVQRVCDILNNIPLLPLLIFFTFILKPSIWIIVLILVVFGWSGLAIVVRSIVLQARDRSVRRGSRVSWGEPWAGY